tara:strand:+ start:5803 stop:6141 length:339 start_codon:yes stop_codon:yes gene_type:complete
MAKPWKKYLDAFKNADKIAEGIKNNIFKKEHVEAIFTDRFQTCVNCKLYDAEGTNCAAPGTQPCCSDCGCSLAFKLRSLSSSCPKGHWPSVVFSDTTENQINQQIKSNDNSN